jgi:hypothetical protein
MSARMTDRTRSSRRQTVKDGLFGLDVLSDAFRQTNFERYALHCAGDDGQPCDQWHGR